MRPATARASRRGSSRSRRTAAPTIPGSHAYRRQHAAERDDVRPARSPLRVLLLRQPLVHERGVRPGRRSRTRCSCARPRRSPASTRCASAGVAARRDRDLCAGPGPARAGVRRRPLASTAPISCAGTLRIVDDGVAPPARPGVSRRIGLGAGQGRRAPATASTCPATRTSAARRVELSSSVPAMAQE